MIETIIFSSSLIFIYMSSWFIVALLLRRNDLADLAWGLGFVLLTLATGAKLEFLSPVHIITATLVSIWGLRLALHIGYRLLQKEEDIRYANWRKSWGKMFLLRTYFQIFMLQGFLLLMISLPILAINNNEINNFSYTWVILGLIIWLIGFLFETIGDQQLKNFLEDKNNQGKIIQTGLWRYTRHPNYFGEVTMWWGIWFISFMITENIYTVIGPLTITFLILKVSGIPMLEKNMSKNPAYLEYANKTSVFFPWFPQK